MARMTGFVETMVKNQNQPPLLTDAEQAGVLRARRRVDDEDVAAVLEALSTTAMAQDEDSSGNPAHADRDSRRR